MPGFFMLLTSRLGEERSNGYSDATKRRFFQKLIGLRGIAPRRITHGFGFNRATGLNSLAIMKIVVRYEDLYELFG